MAYENSVDPDQTAPEGAVWSGPTLFAIQPIILRKIFIKSKIWTKKLWNNVWNFRAFTVFRLFPF